MLKHNLGIIMLDWLNTFSLFNIYLLMPFDRFNVATDQAANIMKQETSMTYQT